MFSFTLPAIFFLFQTALCDNSDVGLTPPQMIENHGYVSEIHEITTEDGYILTYHRIPQGLNDKSTSNKPAALIMHGLTSSSADFVAMGPTTGLAYILADAGYDVWLGNARGNAFSRKHETIDADINPEAFYNFTWHEIGYYDLTAAIDYILDLKEQDSLYYIGHSQGTTSFLVLASTRPEYNSKVRFASLMAAAAIEEHIPNIYLKDICKYLDRIEIILNRYKIYEVPYVKEIREYVSTTCVESPSDTICNFLSSGIHFDPEYIPVIYSNFPSNAGLKQLLHFGQQVRDGGFREYDYGVQRNMEVYGTETPPDYNLSLISTPVAFYYAKADGLVAVEDEQRLISMIPNVANDYLVPDDSFGHGDFTRHSNIKELVYNELLSVMAEY